MNKTKLSICAIALASLGFVSCEKNDDPVVITVKLNQTQIEYDEEGVWSDVATNNFVHSQGFVFKHEGSESPWGLIWQGFTQSRSADTTIYTGEWPSHTFNVMTGGGMSGKGTPYFACFWDNTETEDRALEQRSCHICYTGGGAEKLAFKPMSVYVNNSCYTYYTMRDGDNWTRKFEQGDYLELIAHGVHADGTESETSIRLADCVGDDASKWFVSEWTKFDLSALGEVTDVYFTTNSTDVGQWGMNTPAFFCIDWFAAETMLPQDLL